MPSVRYYNQTSPFWDFVAELENQGNTHPFFGGRSNNDDEHERSDNPWAQGFGGWPFGPMPHRGRHGPPHGRHHHHGPPPPPPGHEHRGPPPPPGHEHHGPPSPPGPPPPPGHEHDAPPPPPPEKPEAGPSEPHDPPTSCPEEPAGPPPYHGHGHGPHHGPGRRDRCGGRGGWGGRGRGPYGFPMGAGAPPFLNNLAEIFQSQIFGEGADNTGDERQESGSSDFKPEVDVFDTTEAFVIHVSLPGAKKEDVGVNWDAEKSELSIAGVVYRPGDEDLLKSLAMDERKVGAFERKVRLGSRANPAQVDVDAISAKMEDGVLRVTVPKQDAEYVEIKKVDIE